MALFRRANIKPDWKSKIEAVVITQPIGGADRVNTAIFRIGRADLRFIEPAAHLKRWKRKIANSEFVVVNDLNHRASFATQ